MPGWINVITVGLAVVVVWFLALARASFYTQEPPGRLGMVAVMVAALPLFLVSLGWRGRARTMRIRAWRVRWFLTMESHSFSFGMDGPPATATPRAFPGWNDGPPRSGVREPRRPQG